MRTLTVCNVVTVDGRYEDDDHDIVAVRDARAEVARLKQSTGQGMLIVLGRLLWNDLMHAGVVDELHLPTVPLIAGSGCRCSTRGRGWC